MDDYDKFRRKLTRSTEKLVRTYFQSPRAAQEFEAASAAKGKPISPAPSAFGLGPMLCLETPDRDGNDKWKGTCVCTADELRTAEAVAMATGKPELAGLIVFYRHTKYGCDHPYGGRGEAVEPLAKLMGLSVADLLE